MTFTAEMLAEDAGEEAAEYAAFLNRVGVTRAEMAIAGKGWLEAWRLSKGHGPKLFAPDA